MLSAFTNQSKTNQQDMQNTKTTSLKTLLTILRDRYSTLSGIMQLKVKTSLNEIQSHGQLITGKFRKSENDSR